MTPEIRSKLGKALLLLGRIILAAIFLYAGYSKLKPQFDMPWSLGSMKVALSMFALQVDSYQMLSASGVDFVSHALPPFEVFLGLWLLSGIALRASSVVTTLQLLALSGVLIRAYVLHLGINCGCFSTPEALGPMRLVEEGAFVALSVAVTIGAFLVPAKPVRSQAVHSELASSPVPKAL
jgi:uncharacterized membrane protein YphA (DoxX/SURF4 family)